MDWANVLKDLPGTLSGLGLTATAQKLMWTLVVMVAMVLLRRAALRRIIPRIEGVRAQYQWRKGISYSLFWVGVLLIGRIWIEATAGFATFLGLTSAGIAVALKDPLVNLAGWAYFRWNGHITVGDRVEVRGMRGDVVDMGVFEFVLLELGNWVDAEQSTGRVVHVPNGVVFTSDLVTYGEGFNFIWCEMPVLITFESDWRRAKTVLDDIVRTRTAEHQDEAERDLRRNTGRYMITYSRLTPIVYTQVDDSGVRLTLRFLCPPRRRRGTEHALWEAILEAFAQDPAIEFAYPTQRLLTEGHVIQPPVANAG